MRGEIYCTMLFRIQRQYAVKLGGWEERGATVRVTACLRGHE